MIVSKGQTKMEDTKQRILEKSLELFSTKGYDSVSVGEIAKAVGIKAPSLYNHFPSKQAIFDAILETTSAHYQKDTAEISVHVQDAQKDVPVFSHHGAIRNILQSGELFQNEMKIFFAGSHYFTAPFALIHRIVSFFTSFHVKGTEE